MAKNVARVQVNSLPPAQKCYTLETKATAGDPPTTTPATRQKSEYRQKTYTYIARPSTLGTPPVVTYVTDTNIRLPV